MSSLSVILCLCGISSTLPRILDSLARQTIDSFRFELVLIVDAASASVDELLLPHRDRFATAIVPQKPAGIAAARNLGVFVARHPVVLFLNNDEVPGEDYLVAHLAAHLAQPDERLLVTGPLAAPKPGTLLTDVILEQEETMQQALLKGAALTDTCRPFAGRFSCKREMLIKHGIYDPDFGCGFEHLELEQRLIHKERRWLVEPRASSVLANSLNFDELWLRFYRWGRQQVRQAAEHPSWRPPLQERAHAYVQGLGAFTRCLRHLRKADRLARIYEEAGLAFDADAATLIQNGYRRQLDLAQSKGVADAMADGWDHHRPVRLQSIGLDRLEAGARVDL